MICERGGGDIIFDVKYQTHDVRCRRTDAFVRSPAGRLFGLALLGAISIFLSILLSVANYATVRITLSKQFGGILDQGGWSRWSRNNFEDSVPAKMNKTNVYHHGDIFLMLLLLQQVHFEVAIQGWKCSWSRSQKEEKTLSRRRLRNTVFNEVQAGQVVLIHQLSGSRIN